METFENVKDRVGTMANKLGQPTQEGTTTKAIEDVTARIPSSAWLVAAGAAVLGSIALKMAGRNTTANFVGEWVPTLLLFGIYNKIVKTLGSERDDVMH